MGKGQSLHQMMLGKLDIHVQKNEVGSLLILFLKSNSKWSKYLNIKTETIRLLEEHIEEKFHDIGFSNFLYMTPKAQATKDKLECFRI